MEPVDRHLALVRASLHFLDPGTVVSHASAAVVHGLWLPDGVDLAHAHVTRIGHTGGSIRTSVHMHHAPLPEAEVTSVDGIPVTTLARTVVDISRELGFEAGVVTADRALQLGLTKQELLESVRAARRRPGNAAARAVLDFADGRSGSPQESVLRCAFQLLSLPRPRLQPELLDAGGRLVAQPDFLFDEFNLAVEYDGEAKYLEAPDAESLPRVVAEKERDEAIRALGYWIVHLGKRDMPLARLQRRMERAIASGKALPLRADQVPGWPTRRIA